MVYLSVLSFIASVIYLYIGYKTYRLNQKSELCGLFFLLALSMTIWSLGSGFAYLADSIEESTLWIKVGAFGWCTFGAICLYFVMIFTGNKKIRLWYVKLLILIPAPVFLFMALFLFGPGIDTSHFISDFFFMGIFLYNFLYITFSIFLIYLWSYKSTSKIQKKQANIIVVSSLAPFLLHLVFDELFPAINITGIPNMGHIYTLIMIFGVNYAINRYQFLSIPTTLITNELFNELTGLTFLVDIQGYIIKANRQVYKLLEYREQEIIGKPITNIIKEEAIVKIINDPEALREAQRFQDILITIKSGIPLPFHISVIPLLTKSKLLQGILVIGEDFRATKLLQEEISKNKHTNELLKNSEMLFKNILDIAPISIILTSRGTRWIKYMNTQAEELLGGSKSELIDQDITGFFTKLEDLEYLSNQIDNQKYCKYEITLKRRNGEQFPALITVVPSIYQEEAVALSCIIDMTEQKKVEETLKQNNENITKLNTDLMLMNDILANKSVKDGLTNLYNHQYMNEVLELKIKEVTKSQQKLCVMMLDIDHFKRVNDQYGHLNGDRILVTVSDLITRNTRKMDLIGRYGGEEFIVVLPGIHLEEAVSIAERIRNSIQDYDFDLEGRKVTISIGIVEYSGETTDALVNKADMLLYQAKHKGRNRVEMILEA